MSIVHPSRKMLFGAAVLVISAWAVAGLPRQPVEAAWAVRLLPEHGAVYFRHWLQPQQLWSMRADGSGKLPLPAGVEGEPSGYLHNRHRWFLSVRAVKGEVRPDGGPCRALFAIRDDGRSVRLALPPDLHLAPLLPRWPVHTRDGLVSWVAGRCGADGRMVEGGIYAVRIDFDVEGVPAVLPEPVLKLLVALPVVDLPGWAEWRSDDRAPDVLGHDWSPDGKSIVIETFDNRLFVADVADGTIRPLTNVPGSDPTWSPDGEWIAFQVRREFGGIGLVRPDGTQFRSILRKSEGWSFVAAYPAWSPTGRHLICLSAGGLPTPVNSPCPIDVVVADRTGCGQQNLTSDLGEGMMPVAWRSNEEATEAAGPDGLASADGFNPGAFDAP